MQRAGYPSADQRARRMIHNSVCMVESVLTNHTGRGGDHAFPVVTPISFRDLTVICAYADGARCAVPLYDQAHSRRTDFDPAMFYLRSAAFPIRHPDHGSLMKVVMKGYFGSTLLHMQRAECGGSFVAEVEPDFELSLASPSADSFVTLYARDGAGNRYAVGTLSMVEASHDVRKRPSLVLAR